MPSTFATAQKGGTVETVTWQDWLLDEHESFCNALAKEHPAASPDAVLQSASMLTLATLLSEIFASDVPE